MSVLPSISAANLLFCHMCLQQEICKKTEVDFFFFYLTQCCRNEAEELPVISKDDNFHCLTILNIKSQLLGDVPVYSPSPR